MRALVFGQSGVRKDDYLGEVREIAQREGRDFTIINLGERMQARDPAGRNPQIYPSLSVTERELMRNTALEDVVRETNALPNDDYVLNAHAVFRLDTGLIPAMDADLIDGFAPDLVVVLIDDFYYIHRRLRETPFSNLSYGAILEWRDAEITVSKSIAQELFPTLTVTEGLPEWKFFVVARGHSPELLYRLFYERGSRLRIYSSFAITGANDEQRNRIADFKSRLAQDHIVFDPYKVVERGPLALGDALLEELAEQLRGRDSVDSAYSALCSELEAAGVDTDVLALRKEFDAKEVLPGLTDMRFQPSKSQQDLRDDATRGDVFGPYSFPLDELINLRPTVDGQIISRDYMLIDQSHVICALIPWGTGATPKPEISAGSQSELTYGALRGKKRYVVCEGRLDRLSPWVQQHATEIFESLEELEQRLTKGAAT